jgi:hypothetical protein
MVSSAKLALSILFQAIRSSSLGSNLKAFILRCLLLWPRILPGLRKVWLWYFQTSSNDEKDTKRDSDTRGPSSTGELRKLQECVVVCASQAFGRVPAGEPSRHFMSGPSDAEPSTPIEDIIRRDPSVHSLSSHAPSRQGSPRLSAPPSPRGSPHSSASSLREDIALSPMDAEWFTRRSSTPVSWTHSRAAGRQFTGVTSRSHSRPSSPSPFPFPFPRRENSPSRIPIEIRGPSRPGTPEDTRSVDSFSPPQGPQLPSATVHGRAQSLSTHHWLPSTEVVNPPADSNGHSPSGYGAHIGAHQSRGSIRPESPMTSSSQSTQAFPRPSIPFPEPSHVGNPQFQQGNPVRPMHSDQVSRYVKNGDV